MTPYHLFKDIIFFIIFFKSIQELFANSHPNHAEGVYIIRNLLRYIISP